MRKGPEYNTSQGQKDLQSEKIANWDMKVLRARYYYDKDVPPNPEEKKDQNIICDAREQVVQTV